MPPLPEVLEDERPEQAKLGKVRKAVKSPFFKIQIKKAEQCIQRIPLKCNWDESTD